MDTIALTMREQQRVAVIERVFQGELTMAEAAMVLGISERQSFRLKDRIRKEGVAGIIHGNRGHRSPFVSWAHKAVEVHVHDRLARFAHTRLAQLTYIGRTGDGRS